MSIIDEYISQHYSERLSLDVTEEDITWQLRGSHSDYVNTRILFTREKLMAVMEAMLSGLDSDEATLARCRQVLTLWIAGLDTLSKEEEQPDWLPRVHPHSSGQCDLLLKGNPAALTEADEETYLRVTGQQDLPVHRRIPQATFSKTVRYWHRFETWLAEQLQDITQHCYRKLCRFVANATTEPRLLHEYRGEYGSLRLFVGPQNIDEIDILEFNPEYIVSWVDKVADGVTGGRRLLTTLRFRDHPKNRSCWLCWSGSPASTACTGPTPGRWPPCAGASSCMRWDWTWRWIQRDGRSSMSFTG